MVYVPVLPLVRYPVPLQTLAAEIRQECSARDFLFDAETLC
jgi:hypothetical protein